VWARMSARRARLVRSLRRRRPAPRRWPGQVRASMFDPARHL